jgi:glycosyltransferase involved in cell wall biosynthesis
MKPNQPHHTITSLHRSPAGLRSLDLFVDKINAYVENTDNQDLRILVVNDENANYALPIAALGYQVTNLHQSETAMQKAQALSLELGIEFTAKTGSLQDEQSAKYHIVLSPALPAESAQINDFCINMLDKINSQGTIIIGSNSHKFSNLLTIIRESGLRVYSASPASFIFPKIFSKFNQKIKKGSASFHFLDSLDGFLSAVLPRNLATSFVISCKNKSSDKLVAHILPTLESGGGAERLVMQLSERLPEHGFESHIIAIVRGGSMENILREQNIRFTVLERQGIFGRFTNIFRLKNFLQDLNPDIVHTHLSASNFFGRLSARMAGCKNIITTMHNVRMYHGRVGEFFMRVMKNFSGLYIAISEDTASYLKRTLMIPAEKITVIPNGVEIARITKRQSRPFFDIPKILFVGRLEPQKNPDIFLEALAQIRRPYECHIYGQGAMEHELKHLADELGILPRIFWHGVSPDVYDVYANHDLFVMPSAWEGFGLVAIEAAVAGIPMIISDLPVMRELFGEKTVLVKPGNPKDLATAILDTLDRPSAAINRANQLACQDFTKYSIQTMTNKYAEKYRELLA